ncbi:MAG: ABC transporter ATP-binding protein [Nitrospinae bacterium]|nr:ABC transporter ATP-binding protein [Nitrospinota bacterium]
MNEDYAIRVEGLGKNFGSVAAVKDLNMAVRKGELFGLVGPDGAGKTTVMRLLAGIMEPTAGEAWIAGFPVTKEPERVKERIGYMSQRFGLYEDLTVEENLEFYADLYEVPKSERPARKERLLGFSNLAPFKDRLAGALSGGMKQKLGLACALIHTPEALLLDEPTNGVDPVSRRDFWRILYGLLKEGVTVIVTTAYLDEAERCGRVGFLSGGSIIVTDDPKALKKSLGCPMVEINTPSARSAESLIKNLAPVKAVNAYGDRFHVALDRMESLGEVTGVLEKAGMKVEGAREITPSLEDIFISRVGGE